jgi:hypothetical protein
VRPRLVRLVHEGGEAALPEIAPPLLAEIYAPRVAVVRFANGPPESILRGWCCCYVRVIWHSVGAELLEGVFLMESQQLMVEGLF